MSYALNASAEKGQSELEFVEVSEAEFDLPWYVDAASVRTLLATPPMSSFLTAATILGAPFSATCWR